MAGKSRGLQPVDRLEQDLIRLRSLTAMLKGAEDFSGEERASPTPGAPGGPAAGRPSGMPSAAGWCSAARKQVSAPMEDGLAIRPTNTNWHRPTEWQSVRRFGPIAATSIQQELSVLEASVARVAENRDRHAGTRGRGDGADAAAAGTSAADDPPALWQFCLDRPDNDTVRCLAADGAASVVLDYQGRGSDSWWARFVAACGLGLRSWPA